MFKKCPPPVPVLSQINPVHAPASQFLRLVLLLSSHPCLGLPSGLFPSCFPTKTLYVPVLAPMRAACPTNLIIFNFITQIMFSGDYRSLSSSLCSFLHSPVTSSLSGPNIPLSTLFSHILSLCSSLSVSYNRYNTKNGQNYNSVYPNLPLFG